MNITKQIRNNVLEASQNKGFFLTIIICISFLFSFYWVQILNPNTYMFSEVGDGVKTYYNLQWHNKYDTSYLQLNSMNYPFGESLLNEDSLPFINNSLKLVSNIFPSIANYSVGILNSLYFLFLFFGVIFLYLILIKLSVSYYFSALAANAIAFLSSQTLLLNPAGHYALTFVCFFPLGWYLLIRYLEGYNPMKFSILIAVNIFFWSFCHVYLGFALLLFMICFYFFKFIFDNNWYFNKKRTSLHILIQILVPTLAVLLLVKLTDNHPDRIDMPFILSYRATWSNIFLSDISPLQHFYKVFFDLSKIHEVKWGKTGNYIGFSSTIALIILLFFAIKHLLTKNIRSTWKYIDNQQFIFFIASIVVLLYSMAIPIKYLSEKVLNSLPLIKQFSSLGRLAWVFYYVLTILSVSFLYKILHNKKWGKLVLFLIISLYIIESIPYHSRISKSTKMQKNFFVNTHLDKDQKILSQISCKQFQAILPLPKFFKYNIPFSTSHNDEIINAAFISSIYSGLPLISVYLSRPSVSEALKTFKLTMPGKYQYENKTIMSDDRNIAIVICNNYMNKLNENELNIVSKSDLLMQSNT
ncbi:MAG: hypothetical protein PF517_19560 [Salinivirgaceae bacterium]|jgi:hypothetical protein|nr:hypothetical protein [Salinivirgaceae bacterium]